MLNDDQIRDFQRDGAVVVRGIFADWINVKAAGFARNVS